MTDLTRKGNFSEKKGVCIASARVTADMVEDTTPHILFNLPKNAVVTKALAVKEAVSNGGVTADLGFDGGSELLDDEALSAVAVGDADVALATETGKQVTATFSAVPTAGIFVFVVEFIEYDLSTGKLMEVTRAVA